MSPESAPGRDVHVDDEKHTTTKVVMISVVAAIGGFLFGFDTSVINGAVKAVTNLLSKLELEAMSSLTFGWSVVYASPSMAWSLLG